MKSPIPRIAQSLEQLKLDLEAGVEDDLSDLDFTNAERMLREERAARAPARVCKCLRRGANYMINADGQMVCLKCGRRW